MSFNIFTTTAFTTAALIIGLSSPIWAQGGDDPIAGIDVILKKDPSSKPIKPFSFNASEIKQINALKGDDRPHYALKLIAEDIGAGEAFVASGMKAFDDIWCGPCKMADTFAVEFKTEKAAYSLTVKFRAGADLSE